MDVDIGSFGFRLWYALKVRNMTQKELAERIGVSAQTISGYTTGIKKPTIDKAIQIAHALNVSLDFLFLGEELKNG